MVAAVIEKIRKLLRIARTVSATGRLQELPDSNFQHLFLE
jgi:hypothetical protein